MQYSGSFRPEFEKIIVTFEISVRDFLYGNFHTKIKIPAFRTKIALFGYIWAGI